eukprot:c32508_g1_i1 orf=101-271(+)
MEEYETTLLCLDVFFQMSQLEVNIKKTQMVVFQVKDMPNLMYGGQNLKRVTGSTLD